MREDAITQTTIASVQLCPSEKSSPPPFCSEVRYTSDAKSAIASAVDMWNIYVLLTMYNCCSVLNQVYSDIIHHYHSIRISQKERQRSLLLVGGRTRMLHSRFSGKDDLKKCFWKDIHFGRVVVWKSIFRDRKPDTT